MIVLGAAPPMVDALRRVRRCMSQRLLLSFLPRALASADVLGPFHYCASFERAAPDAPETIDDQEGRSTVCRYQTIYAVRAGARPYDADRPTTCAFASPVGPRAMLERRPNHATIPGANPPTDSDNVLLGTETHRHLALR